MREILFRGKTVCDGDWVYGGIIWNPSRKEFFIHTDWDGGKVIPETVGQYTGLTDSNGTMIFEGDIIEGANEYLGLAVVLYDKGQFLLSFGDTLAEYDKLEDVEVVGEWHDEKVVIGNIYDNPELLEGKS